jgi:hypothetical protein
MQYEIKEVEDSVSFTESPKARSGVNNGSDLKIDFNYANEKFKSSEKYFVGKLNEKDKEKEKKLRCKSKDLAGEKKKYSDKILKEVQIDAEIGANDNQAIKEKENKNSKEIKKTTTITDKTTDIEKRQSSKLIVKISDFLSDLNKDSENNSINLVARDQYITTHLNNLNQGQGKETLKSKEPKVDYNNFLEKSHSDNFNYEYGYRYGNDKSASDLSEYKSGSYYDPRLEGKRFEINLYKMRSDESFGYPSSAYDSKSTASSNKENHDRESIRKKIDQAIMNKNRGDIRFEKGDLLGGNSNMPEGKYENISVYSNIMKNTNSSKIKAEDSKQSSKYKYNFNF